MSTSSLCVFESRSVHILCLLACGRKGAPLLLDNGVSLEESVAEWLCTAAGSGLSVPPTSLSSSCNTTTSAFPPPSSLLPVQLYGYRR